MVANIISTQITTAQSYGSGDTLSVTRFGSVVVASAAASAVSGAGRNVVIIDGVIAETANDGTGLDFAAGDDMVTVGAGAIVYGGRTGIAMTGSNAVIDNYGQIIGQGGFGVETSGGGAKLNLYATSVVQGRFGIQMDGQLNSIVNLGTVLGQDWAVFFGVGSNAIYNSGTVAGAANGLLIGQGGTNFIVNTGTIRSYVAGRAILALSAVNITNSGLIDSVNDDGISFATASASTVVNTGYIFGRGDHAVEGSSALDTIVNNGFMLSKDGSGTALNGGADLFDGRDGLQFGGVYGGDGDDALLGGAGYDFLYGGNDNDTLSGGSLGDYLDGGSGFDYARYDSAAAAVTASLANPAANTGEAATDTYVSIEGLIGSGFSDLLVGDAGANTLFGLGGDDAMVGGDGADTLFGGDGGDVLSGGNGNDVIAGQAGADVLYGGAGADVFSYTALADGGDFIADFNAGGVKDGFDLRPLFDKLGYTGNDPRSTNLLQVLQNGADTDVYVNNTFLFRIPNLYAPALNDTYFQFQ